MLLTCNKDASRFVSVAANFLLLNAAVGSLCVAGGGLITRPIPCALAALSIAEGTRNAYDQMHSRIISADDDKLLLKLGEPGCGLTKITSEAEGCFRKYVGEAICRIESSPNYESLSNRFEECFSSRPDLPCNDWF